MTTECEPGKSASTLVDTLTVMIVAVNLVLTICTTFVLLKIQKSENRPLKRILVLFFVYCVLGLITSIILMWIAWPYGVCARDDWDTRSALFIIQQIATYFHKALYNLLHWMFAFRYWIVSLTVRKIMC